MKLHTAATAFMDNTTWIASSRSNMQKILEEAAIFYKANDSQINSKKSVLITINAPKNNPNHSVLIGPNKEILQKTEKNEFARYLEIWLGEKDHKKYTINLVQREIFHITQALKHKKTTDKSYIYLTKYLYQEQNIESNIVLSAKMNVKNSLQNTWVNSRMSSIYQKHVQTVSCYTKESII